MPPTKVSLDFHFFEYVGAARLVSTLVVSTTLAKPLFVDRDILDRELHDITDGDFFSNLLDES